MVRWCHKKRLERGSGKQEEEQGLLYFWVLKIYSMVSYTGPHGEETRVIRRQKMGAERLLKLQTLLGFHLFSHRPLCSGHTVQLCEKIYCGHIRMQMVRSPEGTKITKVQSSHRGARWVKQTQKQRTSLNEVLPGQGKLWEPGVGTTGAALN